MSPRVLGRTALGVLTLCAFAIFVTFLNRARPVEQQSGAASLFPLLATTNAAPEFPDGYSWINTEKPLSLRGLRGKVVLLDFWTYGCINCIHILPDLKKLEAKYPSELVVIGVHSAKFQNESDAGNIRNAVMRYNISHPVVVDQNMTIWNSFGVNAWPTFVVIDPNGNIAFMTAGEGNYNALDSQISRLISEARRAGKLSETPLQFTLAAAQEKATPLRYPGKILADEKSQRLFIADTVHNRIVISDFDGNVISIVGNSAQGLKNGDYNQSSFNNPQGMALSRNGDLLYIADTNNHAIRVLNLEKKTVSTLAGTGKQAAWRSTGGVGTQAALSSPWDVLLLNNSLYIAMAGPHQIWKFDLDSRRVAPWAGSGYEARTDGSLQSAALAQPSGLATDGTQIFFADSESSSVRSASLRNLQVKTLAGGGNVSTLFTFGDRDGNGTQARLQHPLAVVHRDGIVYVADTYNHKIKTIDVNSGATKTLAGGDAGFDDGDYNQSRFNEPAGLSLADDKLFIADTNNHAIRVLDLQKKTVATLNFKNLAAPAAPKTVKKIATATKTKDGFRLPLQKLAPGARGEFVLDLKLPAGHYLNDETPQRFMAKIGGKGVTLAKTNIRGKEFVLPLRVSLATQAQGRGVLDIAATVFYCTSKQGLCFVQEVKLQAPFEIAKGGAKQWKIGARITGDHEVAVP